MKNEQYPKMHFSEDFEERDLYEANLRGYMSHITIETEEGIFYPVFFYIPLRINQELEIKLSLGKTCIAEPGLIVLADITLENMKKAVNELCKKGYFSHMKPLQKNASIV
jgi:hypothetical protein